METTVNTVSNFTGVSVNIPDHVARQIVARGGTHLLSNGHQRPDTEGAVQGFGGVPCCWLSPVLSSHTAADSVSTSSAGRFVNAGPKYRAKLIARTETMYAQNESALATYEASDADPAGRDRRQPDGLR